MTKVIDLEDHWKTPGTREDINSAKEFSTGCPLIYPGLNDLFRCPDFDQDNYYEECIECEVPRFYPKAKKELSKLSTKLILTGKP